MDLENTKIIIASGPVIIEGGKVLLNRHGKNTKEQKYWKFVGGRMESFDFTNETQSFEEACKRETKEEMGINIEIIRPLKPMMIKTPDQKNTVAVLIHYLAKRIGEIKPGKDILQYK